MSVEFESTRSESELHPLDNVEDVLQSHNWVFDRVADDELMLEIAGKIGQYKLYFIWQEDMSALQFCAQIDLEIAPEKRDAALKTLTEINENLWMGHFDLPRKTNKPSYRYTCLLRGVERDNATGAIEDMVDISLAQCERHYPLLTLLAGANDMSEQALSLALMTTAGES